MHTFSLVSDAPARETLVERLERAGFVEVSDEKTPDVQFSFFIDDEALDKAYFGAGGIIERTQPKALVVDLSTTVPSTAREISALIQVQDGRFVAAPLHVQNIAHPDPFASRDNVVALVAGEPEALVDVAPLMSALSGAQEVCGEEPSLAQMARCALAIQQAIQLIAHIESDALLHQAEKPELAYTVSGIIARRNLASPQVTSWMQMVRQESYASTYTIEMMMHELTCALTYADEAGLIVPQTEAALYLLRLMATLGGISLSPVALTLAYQDEEVGSRFGLNWDKAEEVFASLQGDDDYDDEDDSVRSDDEIEGWGWEPSYDHERNGYSSN